MGKNELLKEALNLKADEKFLIIEELLKSIDNPDKENDRVWKEEAENRLEAYRKGQLETVSSEEFFKFEN